MNKDVYGILGDLTAEVLLEIIAECMDDYLYVLDLQNNKMEISQSALDRFMISETYMRNAKQEIMSAVYEEDRAMFEKHMQAVMDGKEKVHDIHYRWLDKNGLPVWVNCRGVVIDDEDGKPGYLVGCLNETGNQRRADNVTGLLGGMEFCDYLRSQKKPVTTGFLMHIGIDDFAAVNGTHGSNYGDYVLKSVADCMKECLSGNQRLFHLIADQYVIVDLDSTSMDDAIQLKKKIGEKIDEFIISEQYEVVFSASAGVIDASTVAEGYEECRKKFEFSLKKAKQMGKNNIYFYRQEDYEKFQRNGRIISALRSSIANGCEGFEVYYQPIVDCVSGRVIGAEALMRYTMVTEEGKEWLSPVEFIPLLEKTGLIIPAGRFVLNEAAKMCREIQQYIPEFRVNVNISCYQIEHGKIADKILTAVRDNGLTPDRICIEMTESGFMDMTPAFCKFRKVLEENGIQFVIDDFGTGYSNLHCISDMNPGYVKMDKDFTAKAMSCERDYELFKKIIEMVHSIGIRICVEGIEEEDWHLKMKELQADYLQGYFFGKPCEKKKFMEEFVCNLRNKGV
ncbi:GGDEF and EAL domain-containing protein [Roseburia inulinivorans]|jgi:diguanylate cyclase (GGDEF)-like protein|uniref:GGDEF and EAL domain-containing protein n=1 Tax=Roseburia inulinivorans TaxID=360807 RepID=UPI00248FDA1E|nr:GGDEF and EAL domain-containing protein [Roseburia inulinivorans]